MFGPSCKREALEQAGILPIRMWATLAMHLLVLFILGIYFVGHTYHIWQPAHLPDWLSYALIAYASLIALQLVLLCRLSPRYFTPLAAAGLLESLGIVTALILFVSPDYMNFLWLYPLVLIGFTTLGLLTGLLVFGYALFFLIFFHSEHILSTPQIGLLTTLVSIFLVAALSFLISVHLEEETRKFQKKVGELEKLSNIDELTQLLNRRAFTAAAETHLRLNRRDGRSSALLMLDIDFFKRINDTWGHDAGDLILKTVATVLRNAVYPSDIVGRLGGEEFAIFLDRATLPRAQRMAEHLLNTVRRIEVYTDEGERIPLTISIGVAVVRDPDESLQSLMKRADIALYEAKAAGRNCSRVAP